MLPKMTRPAGQSVPPQGGSPTLDPAEVERFRRMAEELWDPRGKFRPLHQIGPVRLQFIRDELTRHFKIEGAGMKPLTGLSIADIGCGGGLISEPLTRLGAKVTGIDPATRTFQALRIVVNDELGELQAGLTAAEQLLRPQGRLVVVSFHALEDRIVKEFLRARDGKTGQASRHRPANDSMPAHFTALTRRPVGPDDTVIAANPRARSARLRAAERTAVGAAS